MFYFICYHMTHQLGFWYYVWVIFSFCLLLELSKYFFGCTKQVKEGMFS